MSTESAGNRPEDMMGVMAERLETNLQALPDTRDFGSWVTSEQKRVFLLCRRMLQDAEDADSATQDTFLKAWQALNRPESKAQRVRRAPPSGSGTVSRRTPFCASSLEAQRVRRAPPSRPGTVSRRGPFWASSLEAHSAGRARWVKKTIAARCVVRDVY
jgi:hypothetical protein